jgi:hypothetical protein
VDWENPPRLLLTFAKLYYNLALVGFVAAVYSAVLFRSHVAAFVAIGCLVLNGAGHLAVGILGYRETMSRPWPKVPPIKNDDDDW